MKYVSPPKTFQESDATPAALFDFTEAQTFLRIDGTTDQTLVESLISATTKRVEEFLGRKLITQVWSIYYDFFPRESNEEAWWDGVRDGAISELSSPIRSIELPFGPCQSLYYLRTIDETDGTQNINATTYSLDTISSRPIIALKSGGVWPSTLLRPVNGVHVKGTFGYGSTGASVPAPIKEAIKIMVAKLYEHRGDLKIEDPFPATAQMLLEPYTTWRV